MTVPRIEQVRFLDLESSGLHRGAFPIEIGWASPHDLSSFGLLVRPEPSWTLDRWSEQAALVHNIAYGELQTSGRPVAEVAHLTNDALRGCLVLSDANNIDDGWMRQIFDAARIAPVFSLEHAYYFMIEIAEDVHQIGIIEATNLVDFAWQMAREVVGRTHRAAQDALCLATAYRFVVDTDYANAMLAGAKTKSTS